MDEETERKLTNKERKIINEIEKKAEQRKHIPQFTPKFIVNYLFEEFKDFSYDGKEDAEDMLNSICLIAKKSNVMTDKQIEKERRYIIKKYIKGLYDDEDE